MPGVQRAFCKSEQVRLKQVDRRTAGLKERWVGRGSRRTGFVLGVLGPGRGCTCQH